MYFKVLVEHTYKVELSNITEEEAAKILRIAAMYDVYGGSQRGIVYERENLQAVDVKVESKL